MMRWREFSAAVLPAVAAFALSGIYCIADGFFVGRSIGDQGLSAINIAYPVVSLIQSCGTGIGMGGAVLWELKRACGEKDEARRYLQTGVWMLVIASALLTCGLFPVIDPMLRLLGAEGTVLEMGRAYLRVIIPGALFQVLATGLVPVIRNDGGAVTAMVVMILGFVTNIVLDDLMIWVWKLGTTGAAAATVLGQLVTAVGALLYVLRHRLPVWGQGISAGKALGILKVAVAPFGLTLCPMLSLMLINRACMQSGGASAVACYACIAYAVTIVQLLMEGVGDGSQPLMSRSFGEGRPDRLKSVRRMAYTAALLLALLSDGLLFALRDKIGPLFGASGSVAAAVAEVMPVFLLGMGFYGISRVATSGFYATGRNLPAYLCVYAEPTLLLILLWILPGQLGQAGVWWSVVLSQILTAVLALFLQLRTKGFPPMEKDAV
ncbi:MAG: MATE family efflux transporter [Oscillospiraceae bacterium]|nr:MATE family efflux transporter [Oscillospiraceae bacterium]